LSAAKREEKARISTNRKDVLKGTERNEGKIQRRTIMYGKIVVSGILALALLSDGQAHAHTPLCSCIDNGDGTITCQGGFSDGSAAAGVETRVEGNGGAVLIKGKMDSAGEFTFTKPRVPFTFVFDAGPGHVLRIREKDIR
jgi:hypothetical protein